MKRSYVVTLLRMLVGWHFLYEGAWKLLQGNWSAAGYLKASQWVGAEMFHKIADTPALLSVINQMNMWSLTLIGLALILGVCVRFASVGGLMLLALYYCAQPPFIAASADGHFLWIDRNVIEALAMIVFIFVPSNGIGVLFNRWLRGGKDVISGERREFLRNFSAVPVLGAFGYAFFKKHGPVWEEENLKARRADVKTSATVRTFEFKDMSELKKPISEFGTLDGKKVSRMFMGCNLIGGWAHARDLIYVNKLVKAYHEDWRVFKTLHMAEKAGMNTIILNPGLFRVVGDYKKNEGGKIQVMSDCAAGLPVDGIKRSIDWGAEMLYLQGEMTEKYILREKNFKPFEDALSYARSVNRQLGIGAHSLEAVKLCIEHGLVPDYWVKTIHPTSYWSANVGGRKHDNIWCDKPDEVIDFMNSRKEPWVGFKTLAAGAVHPNQGFPFALKAGADFLCVGMYDFQLVENVNLFNDIFADAAKARKRPWCA